MCELCAGIGERAQLPKVAILTYGRSAEYSLEKRTIRSLLGPRAPIVCMISGGKVSRSHGPTLVGF